MTKDADNIITAVAVAIVLAQVIIISFFNLLFLFTIDLVCLDGSLIERNFWDLEQRFY